jgi:phage shock protein A
MTMEHGFDVLEEKVRKAAELVTRLRKENQSLERGLAEARTRLAEAEKRLAAAEAQRGSADRASREAEGAARELLAFRREREEIKKRLAKIVEILDRLE